MCSNIIGGDFIESGHSKRARETWEGTWGSQTVSPYLVTGYRGGLTLKLTCQLTCQPLPKPWEEFTWPNTASPQKSG